MNDQVTVGVGNGAANLAKEIEPFAKAEVARLAIRIKPLALDIFHDEIGHTVFGYRSAVEPGDIGMGQAGEDALFALELTKQVRAAKSRPHQLNGDFPAQ